MVTATNQEGQNSLHLALSDDFFARDDFFTKEALAIPDKTQARFVTTSDIDRSRIMRLETPSIPFSKHLQNQRANKHRLVSTLISPFDPTPGDAKNNRSPDKELLAALFAQDNNGNTPLHYGFDAGLLTRIANIDYLHKVKIVFFKNNQGETILHRLCRNTPEINDYCVGELQKLLGNDGLKKGLLALDHKKESPIDALCRSPQTGRAAALQAILNHKLIEHPSVFRFALQKICARKQDAKDDYALLDIVCTQLEEAKSDTEKERAVAATNGNQWNALHFACLSGDTQRVERVLRHLSPECRHGLITAKTNNDRTALDIACTHGNREMVEMLLTAMDARAAYRATRANAPRNLRNGVAAESETTITHFQYDQMLKKKFCLIEAYEYLKTRSQEFNYNSQRTRDFNNRFNDFVDCMIAREKDLELPPPRANFESQTYWCFFKSSSRYHEQRKHFGQVGATEVQALRDYLKDERDPLAKKLLDRIEKIAPVQSMGLDLRMS